MQYFPNAQRVIDFWIIITFDLLSKIIIEDVLPVSEMPPVQFSPLLASPEKDIVNYSMKIKDKAIGDTSKELIHETNQLSIPSKEALLQNFSNNLLLFDGIGSLRKNPAQFEESFEEQKLAITTCIDAIDQYRNPSHDSYIKMLE